jgi:mRNA interferase RelE/StbE
VSFAIEFTTAARQQLQSLDHQIKRRISAKIEELAENPRPSGVKEVSGRS